MAAVSKSTDKMALLIKGLEKIPKSKIAKVKTFSLKWELISQIVVPVIEVTFKD